MPVQRCRAWTPKSPAPVNPQSSWCMPPINLPRTDVVVIGMGAAGGLAVLPLARAGLKIVGLEAGGWFKPSDHLPDEIRNNVRHWPHAVQKANQEVPTVRVGRDGPALPRPAY